MLTEGARYAVGSLGALVALFGSFLLLWGRYQHCVGGCRLGSPTRLVAWTLVILGGLAVGVSLLLPPGHAPEVPAFLRGG